MRTVAAPLLCAVTALVGCGMQPADTRIQTRGSAGLDVPALEVVAGEFVCPHIVSVTGQAFDVKALARGNVRGQFGPFVPCLTPVSGSPGSTGTCPTCGGEYRIPSGDEDPEAEPTGDKPPLAVPKLRSPFDPDQLIDPVAVFVKGSKDSILGYTVCPSTQRHFIIKESDLLLAVDHPGEVLDPSGAPIDPTVNADSKGGVVQLASRFEGVCWQCGGIGICPNCKLAGEGNLGIYGSTPAECWMCGTSGRCPECGGDGFCEYEGTLPKAFSLWGRESALASKQRKWKYPAEHRSPAGSDGPEAPDNDG
ncbi:MAG: hypothetical protein D6731_09250 [Planctomycetota bacterium]|nr:MAG: hypothetical protein D6731_09250 [Planctomycetota bacterium]